MRGRITGLFSFLVAAVMIVGTASPGHAIIGGTIDAGQRDWAAAFVTDLDRASGLIPDRTYCSGTLVAPQWVLTAKHCLVSSDNLLHTTVLLGREYLHDLNDGEKRRIDGYAAFPDADVALVHLSQPSAMRPLRVGSRRDASEWRKGGTYTVFGYGWTQDARTPSDRLKLAHQVLTDRGNWTLQTTAASIVDTSSGWFCHGDSGGALVAGKYPFYIIGVVSYHKHDPCSAPGRDVYTKVAGEATNTPQNSPVYRWIASII